jgi:hypothetical protein
VLDSRPVNAYQSGLHPNINRAEKCQQEVRDPEDQKALIKTRAYFNDDEHHAHCHEQRADYLQYKIKHKVKRLKK